MWQMPLDRDQALLLRHSFLCCMVEYLALGLQRTGFFGSDNLQGNMEFSHLLYLILIENY